MVEVCGPILQGEIKIAGWASGAQIVVPVCVGLPEAVYCTAVGLQPHRVIGRGLCGDRSPFAS